MCNYGIGWHIQTEQHKIFLLAKNEPVKANSEILVLLCSNDYIEILLKHDPRPLQFFRGGGGVFQTNPLGFQLFSYVHNFFCSNKFAQILVTCVKTLYIHCSELSLPGINSVLVSLQLIRHFSCTVKQNRFKMSVKIRGSSRPISPTKCIGIDARVILGVLPQYLRPCWCQKATYLINVKCTYDVIKQRIEVIQKCYNLKERKTSSVAVLQSSNEFLEFFPFAQCNGIRISESGKFFSGQWNSEYSSRNPCRIDWTPDRCLLLFILSLSLPYFLFFFSGNGI